MNKEPEGRVALERNGKTYTATYRIEKRMITVSTAWGRRTTQLGSSPPETLARIILGEMIDVGEA